MNGDIRYISPEEMELQAAIDRVRLARAERRGLSRENAERLQGLYVQQRSIINEIARLEDARQDAAERLATTEESIDELEQFTSRSPTPRGAGVGLAVMPEGSSDTQEEDGSDNGLDGAVSGGSGTEDGDDGAPDRDQLYAF